jgi:hypothetical protein
MTSYVNPDADMLSLREVVRLALSLGCRPRIREAAVAELVVVELSTADRGKAHKIRIALKENVKHFTDAPASQVGKPTVFTILVIL